MSKTTVPNFEDPVSFNILIDGKSLASVIDIISIEVTNEINQIPCASLVISEGRPGTNEILISDGNDLLPGNKIEIALGYGAKNKTVFIGIITEISLKVGKKGALFIVNAKNDAVKMTLVPKTRTFNEATDSEAITQVVQSASVLHKIKSSSITHPQLFQYQTTDWDFVVSRAAASGFVCWIKQQTFIAESINFKKPPSCKLEAGDNVFSFNATIDATKQASTLTAQGWDSSSQDVNSYKAAEPSIDGMGTLSFDDLADVMDSNHCIISRTSNPTNTGLQSLANVQLLQQRLAKLRGTASIQGQAHINPNDIVELSGFGGKFDGNIFVSCVNHKLAQGNWTTTIEFGLHNKWGLPQLLPTHENTIGSFESVSGLQIGRVMQLQDDPGGHERLLIELPLVNASEKTAIWARLATLDAGKNKGTTFRPDIDDEVIIGFIDNSVHNAIVLGSLHSSAHPSAVASSDDNNEKGIFTRSNMKIVFNDDEQSITIANATNNEVSISESAITLSDCHGNTISMNENGIEINSNQAIIMNASKDIKASGTSVNIQAALSASVTGQAGAELSSSGTTVVKGSLIQIN